MSSSIYIPEEILTKILLNCPSKSVVRFQTVCKSWRSLIRSNSFTSTYNLFHSSSNPLWSANFLITQNKKTRDISVYHTSGSDCGTPLRFSYPHPYKDKVDLVGSAYGAVMLDVKDGLIIWNPFHNKYTKIRIEEETNSCAYGMELYFDSYSNKCCWGLKVMIVKWDSMKGYIPTLYRVFYTQGFISRSEIDWNITNQISFLQYNMYQYNRYHTTNLNHACHWNALRQTDSRSIIVAFDFKSEKFREILLPFENWGYSMTTYKGMLCIGFFQVEESLVKGVVVPFNVYVMKEYGVEESWSSLFVIDIDPVLLPLLIGVRENGDVLIHIKKKKRQGVRDSVVSCNPHNNKPLRLLDEKFDLFEEPQVCYGQSPLFPSTEGYVDFLSGYVCLHIV